MAKRPAYSVNCGKVVRNDYDFQWLPGFAPSQKQKSIAALHEAITAADSFAKPLEISTKSTSELGRKLSAFNLRLNGHTLENIFQSSKVFANGGPFRDLLEVSPKEAKHDERLRNSGALVGFSYNGQELPLEDEEQFECVIFLNQWKDRSWEISFRPKTLGHARCSAHVAADGTVSEIISTSAKMSAVMRLVMPAPPYSS